MDRADPTQNTETHKALNFDALATRPETIVGGVAAKANWKNKSRLEPGAVT